MLVSMLLWGLVAGLGHFVLIGLLYGNPVVARQYDEAMAKDPSVRKWSSMGKYRSAQFLGTQVEVFLITAAYLWFRAVVPEANIMTILCFVLMLAAIRVYPRFWNMWIQTTYPRNLLAIEFINGTVGTLGIVAILRGFHL